MTRTSYLFNREPLWHEHIKGSQHDLSEDVQSWLYEPGSLTRRLRDCYDNNISVCVLFQKWARPFFSETRQLEAPPFRYHLIREVLLHSNGKPLLLARTIIPGHTIKAAHRNLAHLGNRPLGEVIFSYPDLERISMEITRVSPHFWTAAALEKADVKQAVWGRRTIYAIQQRPMLVSEFFLEEIFTQK